MATDREKAGWKKCREESREMIKLMINDEHEVCGMIREMLDESFTEIGMPEEHREEAIESAYDAMIASCIAITCAWLAYLTDGDYTPEGREMPPIIMGMWAGQLFEQHSQRMNLDGLLDHLGMGRN